MFCWLFLIISHQGLFNENVKNLMFLALIISDEILSHSFRLTLSYLFWGENFYTSYDNIQITLRVIQREADFLFDSFHIILYINGYSPNAQYQVVLHLGCDLINAFNSLPSETLRKISGGCKMTTCKKKMMWMCE